MVKFMVAGVQRSGTTMITSALDSHPNIRCLGEVFKSFLPRGKVDVEDSGYLRELQSSLMKRVADHIWRSRSVRAYLGRLYEDNRYEAIGFKFMHNQRRRFRAVVPYVKENQVRVVHVVRENELKTYVSEVSARKRGVYHSQSSVGATKVRITTDDLVQRLQRIRAANEAWRNEFEGALPYLRVAYEELLAATQRVEEEVFEFLDVQRVPLHTSLVKLNPDRLDDVLENYEEVVKCLNHTPFQHCVA